jgi:hypothetical protein
MPKTFCVLCGDLTSGSVGAAGMRWSSICQPCKDKEDKLLELLLNKQAELINSIFFSVPNDTNNGK